MKRYIHNAESVSTKVIFIDRYGKTIIPKIAFNSLAEADDYAIAHDYRLYKKYSEQDVPNFM